MIYHRVTIGGIGGVQGNVPIIGDDVCIGAGATIIGGVRVGDGARIGAGAIVVSDVPAGYTAVGPKATLLPPRSRREFVE